MSHPKRVYLAGPDVFLPNAVQIGSRKKALCQEHGFIGLFPFDNEVPKGAPGRVDRLIFEANVAMMHEADLGIFNLTPFRGPSADAGTVFELGLLAGLRKPLFGYTNVAAPLLARVDGAVQRPDGGWQDADGWAIEDFGNADNLMIDSCLARQGCGLVRIDAGGKLDDLDGFRMCLRMAADAVAAGSRKRARAVG